MKLRFSIRDLLWQTLVVALVVGWWFDSRGRIRQHETDIQRIDKQFDRVDRRLEELRLEIGGMSGRIGGRGRGR